MKQDPVIRVLIADDSPVMRDCLSGFLEQQSGVLVVGTAVDGLEAVQMVGEVMPDVVIMDAQMPNMDGVEATRRIRLAFPDVGVLCLSVFTDHAEASIEAGADGYLIKDCEPEELLPTLAHIVAKKGSAIEKRGASQIGATPTGKNR